MQSFSCKHYITTVDSIQRMTNEKSWILCVHILEILLILLVMGKAEGSVAQEEWHGHVTAVTVAPEFRRLGLAARLMSGLEEISEK